MNEAGGLACLNCPLFDTTEQTPSLPSLALFMMTWATACWPKGGSPLASAQTVLRMHSRDVLASALTGNNASASVNPRA